MKEEQFQNLRLLGEKKLKCRRAHTNETRRQIRMMVATYNLKTGIQIQNAQHLTHEPSQEAASSAQTNRLPLR